MAQRRPEEHTEPLILADRELVDYTDEFMLYDSMFPQETTGRGAQAHPTGRLHPNFTTAEVGRFFFGNSVDWMRWRLKNGHFVLDGEPVGIKRDPNSGFRYFTLADIERMAHALARRRGGLTGSELTTTLIIVRNVAKLYGILR